MLVELSLRFELTLLYASIRNFVSQQHWKLSKDGSLVKFMIGKVPPLSEDTYSSFLDVFPVQLSSLHVDSTGIFEGAQYYGFQRLLRHTKTWNNDPQDVLWLQKIGESTPELTRAFVHVDSVHFQVMEIKKSENSCVAGKPPRY